MHRSSATPGREPRRLHHRFAFTTASPSPPLRLHHRFAFTTASPSRCRVVALPRTAGRPEHLAATPRQISHFRRPCDLSTWLSRRQPGAGIRGLASIQPCLARRRYNIPVRPSVRNTLGEWMSKCSCIEMSNESAGDQTSHVDACQGPPAGMAPSHSPKSSVAVCACDAMPLQHHQLQDTLATSGIAAHFAGKRPAGDCPRHPVISLEPTRGVRREIRDRIAARHVARACFVRSAPQHCVLRQKDVRQKPSNIHQASRAIASLC
jgi:hypothetical protein